MVNTVLLSVATLLVVAVTLGVGFDCGCTNNHQCNNITVTITDESNNCKLEEFNSSFTQVNISGKRCTMNNKMVFRPPPMENVLINGNGVVIDCQNRNNTIMIFENVTNLCLRGITFSECGGHIRLPNTSDTKRFFYGALFIKDSTNVILQDIKIMKSNGGGLYMGMVKGHIDVLDSVFTDNPRDTKCCPNKKRYGGGIYLDQLPIMHTTKETFITIKNCNFTYNKIKYSTQKIDRRYTNHGGGIYLSIKSPGNHINVTQCNFINNTAGYGGGLSITISNCSFNTSLSVTNSFFYNNVAQDTLIQHGGGLYILLQSPLNEFNCVKQNKTTLELTDLKFVRNTGWIGGGFAIVGFCQEQGTEIIVTNCHWIGNRARSGAAMSITRSIRDKGKCSSSQPYIKFTSCTFKDNTNYVFQNSISSDNRLFYLEGWTGPGIFFVIFFNIIFSGDIVFQDNIDTALSSLDCIIFFNDANATFINNTGIRGGAIALQGLSYISPSNSTFYFKNNKAHLSGGAIYGHLLIEANMISAAACFLQNSNANLQDPNLWNSTLTFDHNFANMAGDSIYVTSLIPCQIAYGLGHYEIFEVYRVFNDTITADVFNFLDSNFTKQVSTAAASITMEKQKYKAFPGKKIKMQFQLKDDLGNPASKENFQFETSFNAEASDATSITKRNKIIVKGKENSAITIEIKSQQNPHIAKNITVLLEECPLGYKFNDSKNVCECSIASDSPIVCIKNNFSIRLTNEHYVGLLEDTLIVSFCPDSFCNITKKLLDYGVSLQKNSIELEKQVCSKHRKGILCGECIAGYTVHYNSPNFLCAKETDWCDYGWLLYIVTTFLPLTLIFITITAFNVNLTIGSLRGFLLFCQIIVILDSTDTKSFQVPQMIWKAIYDIFRLRFFYMDPLSFCLMRNATALDMLSFQYIATAYALILVCLSLLWISYCTVYINKCCTNCVRITTLKHSFVTGFSALLILCYGSMATISMNILNTATIYNDKKKFGNIHVYLQGNLVYFSGSHLPYALPAFVILFTIVITPIIVFLSCPLINKCFDYFNFTNSNPASRLASQCYLGGKMKPFYDTFQGCFKEKAQFFAGMYFLYQIMVIVSKIYPTTQEQAFFHTSLSLVIILAIHSLVHPYKKKHHNIIDALLFTDLLLINSLSYYIYSAQNDPDAHFNAIVAKAIQTILIFLPLLIFCIAILKAICRKVGIDKCITRYGINYYNQQRYYRRRSTRAISAVNLEIDQDLVYGTIDNQDGMEFSGESKQFDVSTRKRQLSLSSFVAHEQLLLPK